MKKPNFYIVGAPKCGTSAMNDYLHKHPDVFMAKKELHYFGTDLKTKIKLTESEYLQYFEEAQNERIIGEASVWYLFSETAAKEIKNFSPDARILIMLRNPVDVMQSLHSQHLYDGNEVILDFAEAIGLDGERKKGNNLPDSVDYYQLPPYLDSVLFYHQVKRFLDVFGSEQVCIILYDDFKSDLKGSVAKVLAFLGLEATLEIRYDVINANKRIRNFYLHRLVKKPKPALKRFFRLLIPFKSIRHSVMAGLIKGNINTQKRPPIPAHLQENLKKMLANDIIALSNLIGRDLSAWLE